MTQAGDWTHSSRASASSPVIPTAFGTRANVGQVGGIEKSAPGGSTSHKAMSKAGAGGSCQRKSPGLGLGFGVGRGE